MKKVFFFKIFRQNHPNNAKNELFTTVLKNSCIMGLIFKRVVFKK